MTAYVNVTRDGEFLAGPLTENMAFSWLLRHSSMSVDHALQHEGYAFEPAEWSPLKAEDIFVGRTEDGTRVYLDMSLERQSKEGKTQVTHEPVTGEYFRFSAMGHTVLKGRRDDNWDRGGQMLDALLEVTTPANGWTLAELKEIHRLWKNWHLNDMQAGCQHVPEPLWEDSTYGKRPDLKNTPTCPETGYRWGNAWLVRIIPATVAVRMQELIRKAIASA